MMFHFRFPVAIATLLLVVISHSIAATRLSPSATEDRTVRQILALTYPEGPTIGIKFQGTHRLPRASGEAKIERKRGTTEIEVELDEMKPASLFGGDYNTYVLWAVSPEGLVDNVGEFILRGNRSKLNVTTSLETFGMFVTAEPHFLVELPSRFVVLENSRTTRQIGLVTTSMLEYRGFQGVYNFENESLNRLPEAKGETRPHLASARTAVELARRARAEEFAAEELAAAVESLRTFEKVESTGRGNEMLLGHQVVRQAVEAQKLAEERSFQASLEAERRAHSDEIADLESRINSAKSAADRASLEAARRALEAELEASAREAAEERAEEAARRAAAMESRARLAAEEARRAEDEARRLAEEKLAAQREAAAAVAERERAREQLEQALGRVADVRDTARGLIVNLPDILFDFDRASLRPEGRETLAKIVGIFHFVQGYRLSIEGHTDNVGSDEYNLKLSEKRAQSVLEYLAANGVSYDLLHKQGFGESRPVASNDTNQGRQANRRVEIVFEEQSRQTAEQDTEEKSERFVIQVDDN